MPDLDPASGELISSLVNDWAQRLAHVLESMTGEQPVIDWKPLPAGVALQPNFWWEQPLTLPGTAVFFWVGALDETWREIGNYILNAAGVEQPGPGDARSTYMEVLRQAFTGFAESLGARVGRDVNCENGQEIAAPPPDVSLFAVDLTLAPRPLPAFWLGVAPNLLEVIEKLGSRGAAAEPSALPAAAPAVLRPGVKQNPKALELLLEVELPVSVSFGRTQLPLKDVLKLTTGSIVELNRMVNEPVEVIVNNCVIARGEVVVIEGNYGVRIHEIISRQERLRSLT